MLADSLPRRDSGQLVRRAVELAGSAVGVLFTLPAFAAPQFPDVVDLSDPVGVECTRFRGGYGSARAGEAVAPCGDVNADGWEDFVIGSPNDESGNDYYGRCYVVFGGPDVGAGDPVDLASLAGVRGFRIFGVLLSGHTGWDVAPAGDVNGDGIDDLIIGTWNTYGKAYVLFGAPDIGAAGYLYLNSLNGTNGFELRGSDYEGRLGWSVAGVGDIDQDGDDDLLVGAPNHGQDPPEIDVPDYPATMVEGDVNGDSFVDVIVSNRAGRKCTVYFNAGDGTFPNELAVPMPGNESTYGMVLEDLDGDQDLDLVIATVADSPIRGRIAVILNDGTGTFATPVDYYEGFPYRDLHLDSGDLDGDGDVDILAACAQEFIPPNAAGELSVLLNDGSGAFSVIPTASLLVSNIADIGVSNLDGDADLEAFVRYGQQYDLIDFFDNDGVGGLTKIASLNVHGSETLVEPADLNGDPYPDLVCGGCAVYMGNGYFSFDEVVWHGAKASGFVLADLNGDGVLDYADSEGGDGALDGFTVLRGLGGGEFELPFSYWGPPTLGTIRTADYDADGDLDLAFLRNLGGGDLSFYWNRGDGTFAADDAGRAFVLFGGPDVGGPNGIVNASNLDGVQGFQIPGPHGSAHLGYDVAGVGDVNADGIPDFAVAAYDSALGGARRGTLFVFFGGASIGAGGTLDVRALDGTNGFQVHGAYDLEQLGAAVCGGADVNGDGIDDLCVTSTEATLEGPPEIVHAGRGFVLFGRAGLGSAPIHLDQLDGSDGFVINGFEPSGGTGSSVYFGPDVNGDSYGDLLIGSRYSGLGGVCHLIYGGPGVGASGTIELGALGAGLGVTFLGEGDGDRLGDSVACIGDLDGDGVGEFLLGAPQAATPSNANGGVCYLIRGIGSYWTETFCFADETGSCPCGNESAPGSDSGCENSSGVGARLVASGTPSVSDDDFVLTVLHAAPHSLGIFVQNLSIRDGIPFSDGLACLTFDTHCTRHYGPPAVQPTWLDAAGSGTNAQPLPEGDVCGFTQPGTTLYYQFWYRDPVGPCGSGANLSSGLATTWLP